MVWIKASLSVLMVLSLVSTVYQFYNMVVLDAICRGMPRPKLRGFLAAGGQRGEGLMLYLLGRRKYTSVASEDNAADMKSRKAKCTLSIALVAMCAVGLLIFVAFF